MQANRSRWGRGHVWAASQGTVNTAGQDSCADMECSFAYMEMSLILAKLHFRYDLQLVDRDLHWERESWIHVQWWKPKLWVKIHPRS